jgi:hypothetical protein
VVLQVVQFAHEETKRDRLEFAEAWVERGRSQEALAVDAEVDRSYAGASNERSRILRLIFWTGWRGPRR